MKRLQLFPTPILSLLTTGLILTIVVINVRSITGITEEAQELYLSRRQNKVPWISNLKRSFDFIEKFENTTDFIGGSHGDEDINYEDYEEKEISSSIWNSHSEFESKKPGRNWNGSSFAGSETTLNSTDIEVATELPDTDLAKEPLISKNCQCGLKGNNSEKIVGGTLAQNHAWPWMAALVFVGGTVPRQFCGGSLINNLYILTAAHCVQDMNSTGLEKFRIYLGTNAILGVNSTAVPFQINSVISHPSFNIQTLNYDIALIKLARPVIYNDTIIPICLGQSGAPHRGRTATVAGWGSLSSTSSTVNNLRNVEVKVLPNGSCARSYAKVKVEITQFMMCASLPPYKDACKGDSGGPLFAKRNFKPTIHDQIGIVSFGQDCGQPEFPGVYTRVGRFMKYIRENTKDATYCTNSFSKPK